MGTRSLGSLTLDLIARIGGFKTGMDQAARIATQKGKEIESSFNRLGTVFGRVLGALSIGAIVREIFQSTNEAQKAFAQLNAVVLSSGKVAGLTTEQYVIMSKELQRTTVFTDEAAQSALTLFIQMGKLSGPQIRQALQASADIASRYGRGLEDVATQVARATSGSSRGIERLRTVGVTFTRDQKNLIKELERTGQTGKITQLVLDQISKSTQGASAALRGTLGGALTGLKNQFKDIFELNAGQTSGLVGVINLLADNIDTLTKAALRAAAAYAVFKAALFIGNVVKGIQGFFEAQKAANLAMFQAAAAASGKARAEATAAEATVLETRAELNRTFAMVQGTRATYARIVADEASTASAATRATVTNNAARAEASFAGAATAHALAVQNAAKASQKLAIASKEMGEQTARSAGRFALILAPLRSIGAFIASNPFVAIAVAIATVTVTLAVFADKITLTKDGVVTLANAAQAAFELIGESLQPVANFFKATYQVAKEFFELVIPGTIDWGTALEAVLARIPGFAVLNSLLDSIGKKIEKRAREIAAAQKAAEEAEKKATAAAAQGGGDTPETPFDPNALERIRGMVNELNKQNATLESGAVAAIKLSLATGELSDLFKKAGPAAEPYRQLLIDLTARHEALEKATAKSKATEEARKQIQGLIFDTQAEVDAFDKGEAALFRYRLEHGDLAEVLKKVGPEADNLKNKLLGLHDELDRKRIDKQIEDINLQILKLRGETVKAIEIEFQINNKDLIDSATERGDVKAQEALNHLKDQLVLQAQFNEEREKAQRITDELARQEERIRNSQETGVYSDLEAMGQLGEARENAISQLKQIYAVMEEIAAASDNPELLEMLKNMGSEIENLATQTNLLGQQIESNLKDSFSSAFQEFVKGTKTAGEAFKDFARSVIDNILQILSQNLAQQLFGGFANFLGSAFGGITDIGIVEPLASGGPFQPGFKLVGEEGPELAYFGSPGAMIPNEAMGGVSINNYMDNRGASTDLIRALPKILDERDRRIIAGIRDAKSRGQT